MLCVLAIDREQSQPTWAVVVKPSGLHAVPGRTPDKFDSIQTRARIAFPHADGPITVHRLDRDTSGLMILGLTRASHSFLSVQFQDRKVTKTYAAILEREPPSIESEINLPLIVDWPNRPRHHVNHKEGKPARTRYRVLEAAGGQCRVELTPITGRTHQLRVHASHPVEGGGMGAPILGDALYGTADAPRLMLHATRLGITLPGERTPTVFESPPPF